MEKSEETYNETTLATCISMYITRLVVMESHNRECFLLSSSLNASFLTCPPSSFHTCLTFLSSRNRNEGSIAFFLQRGERRNVKGNKKRKRGRRSVRGRKEGCKLAVRHGVVAPVRACIILAIFHRVIPFRRRNLHSPFLPAAEISGERGRPGFAAKLFRTSCQPVCTYICMKCPFPSI